MCSGERLVVKRIGFGGCRGAAARAGNPIGYGHLEGPTLAHQPGSATVVVQLVLTADLFGGRAHYVQSTKICRNKRVGIIGPVTASVYLIAQRRDRPGHS